jgi:hypothetical protein
MFTACGDTDKKNTAEIKTTGTTADGFVWTAERGGITIDGYTGGQTEITIPSQIENLSVREIYKQAFADSYKIVSVIIPDTVKIIGENAFYNCKNLAEITIGTGVTAIEKSAFAYTPSLTTVNFAAALCDDLESGIFFNSGTDTDGITINVKNTVQRIPANFWHSYAADTKFLPNITKIIFEENSKCNYFPSGTFNNLEKLTQLTLPNTIETINGWAFNGCTNLTTLTLPNSVKTIGDNAFNGNKNLTEIIIPNSVTSIGNSAFYECTNLTTVTIPNSVTSIGDSAFYNCSNLTTVIMSNSVTSIGSYAFGNCTNLIIITIPYTVETLGWYVFSNCSNLTVYIVGRTEAPSGWNTYWNFSDGTARPTIVWDYTGE